MDVSCPWCGARLEGHIPHYDDGPAVPIAGAVSVCLYCARFSMFDHGPFGLILRLATEEECAKVLADPEIQQAIQEVREARRRLQG